MSYLVTITPDNIQKIEDKIKEINTVTLEAVPGNGKKRKEHIENNQRVTQHLIVILGANWDITCVDSAKIGKKQTRNSLDIQQYTDNELMVLAVNPTFESKNANNEYGIDLIPLNITTDEDILGWLEKFTKWSVTIECTNRANLIWLVEEEIKQALKQ